MANVAVSVDVAGANNFGSMGVPGTGGQNNGVWLTDSINFTVGKVDLTTKFDDGVDQAMTYEYRPTDLIDRVIDYSYCADSQMDTCVLDYNYGNIGYFGWNACGGTVSGSHPAQRCTLQVVKINLYQNPYSGRKMACHEIGHSVGLRHTSDFYSCMTDKLDSTTGSLTTHDRDRINANY